MSDMQLNLARKWRSKTFDQLVGQELCVRMLKNSLYLNHLFPVYLFAGQRGCGKTSTARIFARAVNCDKLSDFRETPKEVSIPCLACESCIAVGNGSHPDIIEMDAASHTGVDNVRHIVDAASLLPVLGRKKLYIIDEAHMLSKAAFNALLKLLEEPPPSVLFILATTDLHKVLETVRSRSFQLFFRPVPFDMLLKHLRFICQQESIACDDAGLGVIINETDGSVRDALNLLEQVRFSRGKITKGAVLQLLGHCSDEQLMTLMHTVAVGSSHELLSYIQQTQLHTFDATAVWHGIVELIRALIWVHNDLQPHRFLEFHEQLVQMKAQVSLATVLKWLEVMQQHELLFMRSTAQQRILESVLLQMCGAQLPTVVAQKKSPQPTSPVIEQTTNTAIDQMPWQQFVANVQTIDDPLITSICTQATFVSVDTHTGVVTVSFAQEASFFVDCLDNKKDLWLPMLKEQFGAQATLSYQFEKGVTPVRNTVEVSETRAPAQSYTRRVPQPYAQKKQKVVDVSDKEKWQKAHVLLKAFGGTVTEVNTDE